MESNPVKNTQLLSSLTKEALDDIKKIATV